MAVKKIKSFRHLSGHTQKFSTIITDCNQQQWLKFFILRSKFGNGYPWGLLKLRKVLIIYIGSDHFDEMISGA